MALQSPPKCIAERYRHTIVNHIDYSRGGYGATLTSGLTIFAGGELHKRRRRPPDTTPVTDAVRADVSLGRKRQARSPAPMREAGLAPLDSPGKRKSPHSCWRTYASTGLVRAASTRCAPLSLRRRSERARCRLDVPADRSTVRSRQRVRTCRCHCPRRPPTAEPHPSSSVLCPAAHPARHLSQG